jgi:hypothetical protein
LRRFIEQQAPARQARWEDVLDRVLLLDGTLERDVSYCAAVLDEHVPEWHTKITRPIAIVTCHDCILGQIFGDDCSNETWIDTGYVQGLIFLRERGWIDRGNVFSHPNAVPFWEAEIARRST